LNTILSFVLKYVLEFAWGKLQRYLSKNQKKQLTKTETRKQVARLKKAISNAYDGEPISKEQSREIVDAAKDLMSNY